MDPSRTSLFTAEATAVVAEEEVHRDKVEEAHPPVVVVVVVADTEQREAAILDRARAERTEVAAEEAANWREEVEVDVADAVVAVFVDCIPVEVPETAEVAALLAVDRRHQEVVG